MQIPSPDEALVHAVDRMLAIPQRRGIPLPQVLVPIPFLEPAGLALTSASIAASGAFSLGGQAGAVAIALTGMFGLSAGIDVLTGLLKVRTRLGHAREWSPELAARYRSEAQDCREHLAFQRHVGLALAVSFSILSVYFLVLAAPHPGALPYALAGGGMALAWVGRQVGAYADCAMPHDAGLPQPAGETSAST